MLGVTNRRRDSPHLERSSIQCIGLTEELLNPSCLWAVLMGSQAFSIRHLVWLLPGQNSSYELPIELIIGIVGSILFVAMLMYRLKHGRKAIRLGKKKEVAA